MNKLSERMLIMVILIFLYQTTISCNKESKKKKIKNRNETSFIEFKIDFPDTVYLNKKYNGVIKYKSSLDNIITTFGDKQKNRYTRFVTAETTANVDYSLGQLRKKVRDTFGALDNRTIPFYDIKFSKLGVNYIDGLIDDIVLIDTLKNAKGNDFLPLLRNEVRVMHKVYVIEEKKIKK